LKITENEKISLCEKGNEKEDLNFLTDLKN